MGETIKVRAYSRREHVLYERSYGIPDLAEGCAHREGETVTTIPRSVAPGVNVSLTPTQELSIVESGSESGYAIIENQPSGYIAHVTGRLTEEKALQALRHQAEWIDWAKPMPLVKTEVEEREHGVYKYTFTFGTGD